MFTVGQFLCYWPLSVEKQGGVSSEKKTERESEYDGGGNSEIAVLNALEAQRERKKRRTMVFQDMS